MTEDSLYILGISFVLVVLLFFSYRFNRKFSLINSFIFLLYLSVFLLLGNSYSEYGNALVWFMLLLFSLVVHVIILAAYLIIKYRKLPSK